jgi:hypothetical protein
MVKKQLTFILVLALFIISINLCSAITGSIGNARMVLRLEQGDTIEKYVLIKNVNDVPIDIMISVSGDLEDYIELEQTEFTLNAGEEQKAYFTLEAAKSGTTETNINIKFMPQDEKNGVGLMSTVIVIAQESSFWDFLNSDDEDNEENCEGDSCNNYNC